MHVCVFSCVPLFGIPGTVARQAPPSMGFPRQEYWSGFTKENNFFSRKKGRAASSCLWCPTLAARVSLSFSGYQTNLRPIPGKPSSFWPGPVSGRALCRPTSVWGRASPQRGKEADLGANRKANSASRGLAQSCCRDLPRCLTVDSAIHLYILLTNSCWLKLPPAGFYDLNPKQPQLTH